MYDGENLEAIGNKVKYIGFELEEVPGFLEDTSDLSYSVPKVYDETSYKLYRYVNVRDIEILITPRKRADELGERYRTSLPICTYMKPGSAEETERYAAFLKMINQTRAQDIIEVEKEQDKLREEMPFNVKFSNGFRWQVYYSVFANKYFMLASSQEEDNSQLFYLLKKKIEQDNNIRKAIEEGRNSEEEANKLENYIYLPICNEDYSNAVLGKKEIGELEEYIAYFTKEYPTVYEVIDKQYNKSIQIVGKTIIFDEMESSYNLKLESAEEAQKTYKLIKALFIISLDTKKRYTFTPKIDSKGGLEFYYEGEKIVYEYLPEFMKRESLEKSKENEDLILETKNLKEDIKDLKKEEKAKVNEYHEKEKEILNFLQSKRTFFGKLKFFFAKKKKDDNKDQENSMNKDRLKSMLDNDKNRYSDVSDVSEKPYTVEDLVKICKELEESERENKNIKVDIKALKIKLENLDRKIKNSTQYLEEIDEHRKKSIFNFWKFANKDEVKTLAEGEIIEEKEKEKIKKIFDYEKNIEEFSSFIDNLQREKLSKKELNAIFATNFVLDEINIVRKDELSEEDRSHLRNVLDSLKNEYQEENNDGKDIDIFGNIADDATRVKTLKNNKHRENEKNKFTILEINNYTDETSFIVRLRDIKRYLEEAINKISADSKMALYKASFDKLEGEGFTKFDISPFETLDKLEKDFDKEEIYLYKINMPEDTKALYYSNITYFENDNETLPIGMDVSQEALLNLDQYDLNIVKKDIFNINVFIDDYNTFIRKVNVYEYDLGIKNKRVIKEEVEEIAEEVVEEKEEIIVEKDEEKIEKVYEEIENRDTEELIEQEQEEKSKEDEEEIKAKRYKEETDDKELFEEEIEEKND